MKIKTHELKLPPGHFLTSGKGAGVEYLLDECPKCFKAGHFFWNTHIHKGFCQSCKFKIIGLKQFYAIFNRDVLLHRIPPWLRGTLEEDSPLRHWTSWENNAWDSQVSREFLRARFVTEKVSREAPLYYVSEKDALCLTIDPISPDFEEDLTLWRGVKGFPAKFIPIGGSDTRPTYLSMYGYGLKHIPPTRKCIALFEGAFDILSTGLLGWAVALLGTNFNDAWLSYLSRFSYIVLWLDPDKAGMSARDKLVERFEHDGIEYLDLTLKLDKDGKKIGGLSKEPGDLYSDHDWILRLKNHLLQREFYFNLTSSC